MNVVREVKIAVGLSLLFDVMVVAVIDVGQIFSWQTDFRLFSPLIGFARTLNKYELSFWLILDLP